MPQMRFELIARGDVRTSRTGEIRLEDATGRRYLVELHIRDRRTGLGHTELAVDVKATAAGDGAARDLMDTSLNLLLGETVVVGSSGGEAEPGLVLLLTASD